MTKRLLSICIPSYNRPQQVINLLNSIDCASDRVEIIICEDNSPKRNMIRDAVNAFISKSIYHVRYFENETNFGFDGNLRRLIEHAQGHFVLFMGDDDLFVPNALDLYLQFLLKNLDKKYVLRSYLTVHPDGKTEQFRYLPRISTIPLGVVSVAWIFKRCVTICGFTISRDDALKFSTCELDGTLLYQVYLMAQVCLFNDSVYYDLPFVRAVQSFRKNEPNFGASESERNRYTPGSISQDNSVNFTQAYFEVTEYLDRQHGTQLTEMVRRNLSKYSYPFLSIQRKHGVVAFLKYAKRLELEAGFGCTFYFYIYKWALVVLGEAACDRIIIHIKNVVGHTPDF